MKNTKRYVQQLLGCIMVGGMLINAPMAYAIAPDNAKEEQATAMTNVSGTVYDAATLAPLAGVRVVAHGNSKYAAMTNEEGAYSLSVPGYVTLLDITAPGYNLIQMAVSNQPQKVYIYSEQFADDYAANIRVIERTSPLRRVLIS